MSAKTKKIGSMIFDLPSGNSYADAGLPEAQFLKARSDLAIRLVSEIKRRKLTQAATAKVLGIAQPRVSEIMNARLAKVSIEALMLYFNMLGIDIEITPKPRRARVSASRQLGRTGVVGQRRAAA
jgi:predicted XRE-type DNA-binding protein